MFNRISTSSVSKFRIMDSFQDASGNTIPTIYGPLSFEEVASKKGYRYKEGFWQRILSDEKVIEALESKKMLGMIEHPEKDSEYLSTPYDKASHLVMNVDLIKSVPYGTLALLNNLQGNSIKALVDLGVSIGVSTRGLGTYLRDNISDFVDPDNYALITWDITRNPNLDRASCTRLSDSFIGTPLFKEFVQARQLKDSSDESYNQASLKKELDSIRSSLTLTIDKLNKLTNNY